MLIDTVVCFLTAYFGKFGYVYVVVDIERFLYFMAAFHHLWLCSK
jgi:hypothetical protein